LQPPHWVSEVVAVLARLRPKTASRSVSAILALAFVKIANDSNYYQRAISIALELDHHLIDTFYHDIALELNGTLITADERYYKKAKRFGFILMLDDFDG
jgi:predicted nucleic acid-binding protein